MSTPERTEIKGTAYALLRLDPLAGGRLATRVGALLAAGLSDPQAIGAAVKAYRSRDAESAQESQSIADKLLDDTQLLSALLGSAKGIDADALYDLALSCVRGRLFAGDRKLHDDAALNAHFAEHPESLLLVLVWGLKVNCAGFFGLRAPA